MYTFIHLYMYTNIHVLDFERMIYLHFSGQKFSGRRNQVGEMDD